MIDLLEDPLARTHSGDECPSRVIEIWWQIDFLGPGVADLKRKLEVLMYTARAFVSTAPVGGIGNEVVDDLWLVFERGLGGDAEDTHTDGSVVLSVVMRSRLVCR